ncbi:HEPN domain-containing protein [Streptomyces sp. NPDC051016]|uniref:HEPN domain-containing protein n=1 Tax=Streptomyces sp. NPDC051016 TaxID=3365638 RepID=UPI00379368A5
MQRTDLAMYLNPAWRRCSMRFNEVHQFIDASGHSLRQGNGPAVRSDFYGAWVLMAYASCQYALDEIGQGCMEFLGNRHRYARSMPDAMFKNHERLTLETARRMADENSKKRSQIKQYLLDIYSAKWSTSSSLLKMERNVWPTNVREWLRRIGVDEGDMSWMNDPASPGAPETYASRLAELVEERNPIAHGQTPYRVLSASTMKSWLTECQDFMEHCAMTVELHLSRHHVPRLARLGVLNRQLKLSNRTVPFLVLNHHVRVGDHVLLGSQSERKKIAKVTSIMSGGSTFDDLPAGHEQVAIGLNKPHQDSGVYLTP